MSMNSVRLCVHRAADTIGGNCIEIVAPGGERLLLDAGRPLDTPDDEATPIPLSLDQESPVAGVLLSHAHADHCGLLDILPPSWPVFCGKATGALLTLFTGMRNSKIRQNFTYWQSKTPFSIGPFTITPYLIDHSSFDAYALQVEVGGKRIMYSGDFRAHGRKAGLTEALIKNPPANIDVLIMEGTNLPAIGSMSKGTDTEEELEKQFAHLFKKNKGRIFVSWSSANIDRTVTLFRACMESGRVLVPDLFCMLVLEEIKDFVKTPQAAWGGTHMRAVVTRRMSNLLRRLGEDNFIEYLKKYRAAMKADYLVNTPGKWVIMARDSLVDDYKDKGILPTHDDVWIWSQWQGYLERESTRKMQEFFSPCQKAHMHTSGHASPEVLKRFAGSMRPKMLIPVHGETWGTHRGIYSYTQVIRNGEWINL
jgi:ribonuclease J